MQGFGGGGDGKVHPDPQLAGGADAARSNCDTDAVDGVFGEIDGGTYPTIFCGFKP